ncbi:MAG: hypothetical protein F2843_03880 [Actinobacteria bacterium]|uniref:Unannotated protein n=1 Tax=freshwater metagenome TaxID=449393 RepID=A0A6J7JEE8_9ZZZZ|nr:hypothetical protein [Actinomycetota bacterium]
MHSYNRVIIAPLLATLLGSLLPLSISASVAHSAELAKPTILSSENISIDDAGGTSKVYLNTFRPNLVVSFKVAMNNVETQTIVSGTSKLEIAPNGAFQFTVTAGATLDQATLAKPIQEFHYADGTPYLQVFPAPADFPSFSLTGDTTLIAKKQILSTPVVASGTYALSSIGTRIQFFIKSPRNLIGFRKLSDSAATPAFGGTATYGYLEQKEFDVTATTPGTWRILDSTFQTIQNIAKVQSKFGSLYPEGHGMTIAPSGNPVVILTPTRTVDSSWLKRSYKLPILDCEIAEIHNGKVVKSFSFWDWAAQNSYISEPLLDAMPLFNDPQNPTSSPIDICHANSLQYYKKSNEYLISLRSPSILLLLDANLRTVKEVLNADSSLQHFARFVSPTEITALGNYTLAKESKFLDFTLVKGKWILKAIPFPVHVQFCGNTQYLDRTHIWLAGGCGPFTPGVLGGIFQLSNGKLSQTGALNMKDFIYSYRADL